MIKVVVPPISEGGGRWECSSCHCIFSYDKEDIQEIKARDYYNYNRNSLETYSILFVKCPICGNTRTLNTKYNKI